MQDTSTRAFVLGLDGIPWDRLQTWIDEGHLPNFDRLLSEGASGPLRSTRPASTPLAWPSIATGVWPDKHGLYGFRRITREHGRELYQSSDVRTPSLWDMLTPAVAGNVPMTYPARDIDGKMVTGLLTPEINDRFAHPPSLKDDIERRIPDYEIELYYEEYHDRRDEFPAAIESVLEKRRELLSLLMEEEDWRLFFFVFTEPDRLQHLMWRDDALVQHYRLLDSLLGDVMRYVEEHDANLYVVSDHGFGGIDKFACANSLLEMHGLLRRKSLGGPRNALDRLGVNKERLLGVLDTLDIDMKTVMNYLPGDVVDSVAQQVPGDHHLYDVDFSQTRAFVHDPGLVYINDTERFDNGIVTPDRVPALKRRLLRAFEEATDPDTGEPIFEVYDGVEVYPNDDRAPDVIVEGAPGYEIRSRLTDRLTVPAEKLEASHRPDGIFFAWGPDVEAGASVDDATVVDVAPTLLHAAGEPIPKNADGRVLSELFESGSEPAEADVRSVEYRQNGGTVETDDSTSGAGSKGDDEDDFEDVQERLRGLGYME
jgi:predicted AlkP superfamily phosphohydrolase/phosphomutase